MPDPRVIGEPGEGDSLKVAVTTAAGDLALVYFSNRSSTRVHNVLGAPAQAHWFYPREARIVKLDAFAAGESREMEPPAKWEDAILVLQTSTP